MLRRPAGNEWLKAYYQLNHYSFTHSSFIGNNSSKEITSKGNIEQVYGLRYMPDEDTSLAHIEFSLKYDDLDLNFLHDVFSRIPPADVEQYILQSPWGRYHRIIGFLYEFLMNISLALPNTGKGNYIDLLDEGKYITGTAEKSQKWRINNNLLGPAGFCPVIRRTGILEGLMGTDLTEYIEDLKTQFSPALFKRAIQYLYKKETQSSYAIEKEKPSAERMERFISLLAKAGSQPVSEVLTEEELVKLQNIIVDVRFAAAGFRNFQVYIGEMLPDYHALVHYVCPPPAIVPMLMEGLRRLALKTTEVHAGVRAALIAFGFVFIHPFEDGNGRLHRFLIHDVLAENGPVPEGMIIPVSAHMLGDMKAYDNTLEMYSRPLMQRVKYSMNEHGELTVLNPEEIEGYFRYPDLTAQSIYLIETLIASLRDDMPAELLFIQRYDEAKQAIQELVDMPDRDINRMLVFLHQNRGVFPKRRLEQFPRLTDTEITSMQEAYNKIFSG